MTTPVQTSRPSTSFRLRADVPLRFDGSQTGKQRRFQGTAYSGLLVTDHPFWNRVAFDLSTTRAPQRLPVLRDHDGGQIVGHTERVSIEREITVEGVIAETDHGAEVARLSDQGFPWQMSVHIVPGSVEDLAPGATATVNGHEIAGPAVIFRNSRIREVSFVPVGADSQTRAIAFAGSARAPSGRPTGAAASLAAGARLAGRLDALEGLVSAEHRARRAASVRDLFQALRVEYTPAAAAPYLRMTDEQFAAVDRDLRWSRSADAAIVAEARRRSAEFNLRRH